MIAPAVDIGTLADAVMLIGDGMFWRHAVRDDIDGSRTLSVAFSLIERLLNPTSAARQAASVPAAKVP